MAFEPFEIVSLLHDSADLAGASANTSSERALAARIEDAARNMENFLGMGPKGIFLAAAALTTVMQATWLLNGIDKPVHPHKGSEFQHGSREFSTDIFHTLQAAAATQWSSESAAKYDQINSAHLDHVTTLADADQRVRRILTEQAGEVEKADHELTIIEAFFIPLLTIEAGLLAISWLPGMRANAYALMVLVLVMMVMLYGAAFIIILHASAQGKKSKRELRDVINDYQTAADAVTAKLAQLAVPTVPAAPKSTAPSFSHVMGTGSEVAGAASALLHEHASVATRADRLVAAGQATGISGRVSQYANLGAQSAAPAKKPVAQADSAAPADEEQDQQDLPVDAPAVAAPAPTAVPGPVPAGRLTST